MSAEDAKSAKLLSDFQRCAKVKKPVKSRRSTKPIPIRFTDIELAYLKAKAGKRPLSTYCREQLLGDKVEKRKAMLAPRMEDSQHATLLAALGQSHLPSNLNPLAKHANMDALDV